MTFRVGDRVSLNSPRESDHGQIGYVVWQSQDEGSYTTTRVRWEATGRESAKYTSFLLAAPLAPPRNDARTLRGKIQKRIDAYKSVENPTVAVKAVIEELEGVLSL